ncbi:CHAT domain-containing protein [Caballeronia sp. LjRoot31]|uniref:CHAT domain-containing protein n=1 Tax=Caballeronia sp. LjRoot31 TaxID=3342324 RepID=UPI003F503C04
MREADLRALGKKMFDLVFQDQIRDMLHDATRDAANTDGYLPVEIFAEDSEVAAWPWEFMYHPENKIFIANDVHPISRNIFSRRVSNKLAESRESTRILLILGVSPEDKYTKPDEEIRVLEEVFSAKLGTTEYTLDVLPANDYKKLQAAFQNSRYDIVHYYGHAGVDFANESGYLAIQRAGSEPFRIYSADLAQLLMSSKVRLVFLNACQTARDAEAESVGRNSVAVSLLSAGIPAVVGMQFSLPDISAHSLAASVYRALLTSQSVAAAVREGRTSMRLAENAEFFEWGLPVLYTTDPSCILFPCAHGKKTAISEDIDHLDWHRSEGENGKNVNNKIRVGLLDIDAKVGFLKDIVSLANKAQDYCVFEVIYEAVPSGYLRPGFDRHKETHTYVPRLAPLLHSLRNSLKLNVVCGLTEHLVANESKKWQQWNEFAGSVKGEDNLFVVSTCDLRQYASEANVPFSKAVIYMVLRQLLTLATTDSDEKIGFHKKTVGCLLDDCVERDDLVKGLNHMAFDHEKCREKVADKRQLKAIDSLLKIDFSEEHKRTVSSLGAVRHPRK